MSSVSELISSSNVSRASCTTLINSCVLPGCFAHGVTLVLAIVAITCLFSMMRGLAAIFLSRVQLYFMDAH